ncbi:20886_t:CDS:2, partial [Gigaspora margarita]
MKTGNSAPNRAKACNKATQEWNKIKTKNALEIDNIIKKYLNTSFNLYNIQMVKSRYIHEKTLEPSLSTIHLVKPLPEVPTNAAAQKKAANETTIAKKNLSKFTIFQSRTTLNNYLLPYQFNSIAAKAHHHPAWVLVARVSCTNTREHIDGHYCLASVKCAKQFASVFSDMSVVIFQDNKAKIGLGIPVVEFEQNLISLVYLLMKPDESNNELRTGQLAIFVRHQWSLGIATLSGKLAGVILPIDYFGTHLNTQGKVNNQELALKNFRFAGEALYDIWCHDLVFGKCVNAQYVEEFTNPYTSCCGPPYTKEAIDFLQINNGFLPPITKAKDRHFTNPIYLLEYYDLLKIPNYVQHCPSPDETTYSWLFLSQQLIHPVSCGRPKEKAKSQIEQNSMTLDDFSLLSSQQYDQILSPNE